MSGPKVIRVRWLRLDAIAALDELAAVLEEWRRCLSRLGATSAERQASIDAAVAAVERRMDAGRWRDVTARARALTESLRQEMEDVRSVAVLRAEQTRQQRRNLHAAARTVADALATSGLPVPAELSRVLAHALGADDQELPALQASVDRALGSLRPATPDATMASDPQHALAERLRCEPSAVHETIRDTLAYHTGDEPHDRRLDALLAEIETLDDPAVARPFAARAAAIAAETDADRRTMLTDSLMIDASRQIGARRDAEEALRLLTAARTKLRRLVAAEARTLESRIESARVQPSLHEARTLLAAAETLVAAEAGHAAAAETRRVVLEGLASLGYEVRESMAAAWADAGRVVVSKPSQPGYGVEIASPPTAERLQMRVVAFAPASAARDTSRDADIETLWCAEVERLRQLLQEGGHVSEIERAAPAGAVPLKAVVDENTSRKAERERPRPRARRRP